MYNKKEIWFGICLWGILLVSSYALSYFTNSSYFSLIKDYGYGYAILLLITLAYVFFPTEMRILIQKFVNKRAEDTVGSPVEDDKWKERALIKSVPKTKKMQKMQENCAKEDQYQKIWDDLKAGKADKLLKNLNNKLSKEKEEKNIAKIRAIMEFCYSSIEPDETNLKARIENLEILVKIGTELSMYPTFLYMLTMCYYFDQNYPKAQELFAKTIDLILKQKDADTDLISNLYDMNASICLKTNKYQQAILYYKKAMQYSTEDAVYLFKIALIYFSSLFNSKQALQYAKESFSKLQNKSDDFFETLIHIYYRSAAFEKNFSEAYEVIDNYNKYHDSQAFLADKSYIALKIKDLRNAYDLSQKVLDTDPKNSTAINVKGQLAIVEKDYSKAVNCFNSIIADFEKDINNSFAKYYLAEIFYKRGVAYFYTENYEKAQEDFNQAESLGYDEMDITLFDKISVKLSENIQKKLIQSTDQKNDAK